MVKRTAGRATAALLLVAAAWVPMSARPQTTAPTQEQIDIFKNLPKDQQDSILQGMGGRGGSSGSSSTGKKTDRDVQMPGTVRQKKSGEGEGAAQQYDELGRPIKQKTADGRPLRIKDEDPELRADDTLLIELKTKVEALEDQQRYKDLQQQQQQQQQPLDTSRPQNNRKVVVEDLRTEIEKKKDELFEAQVRKQNPYKLNRFGVLELPGVPAIPLAGLTADEATNRLSADTAFAHFIVRVTLLRLKAYGEEDLKPFGYDLFEGEVSTFAPVTDIPVPGDYVVGPGDVMNVQLYGNEPSNYTLSVDRNGRVNFPKLGPITVGGMSFDRARGAIEGRVREQLIGSRVSVSMGDLRTIRVYVLGEANTPGSYTVSGLATLTNALFVSGGIKKIGSLRNIQLKRQGRLVTTLDLYDLLLRGDTSADRQLLPGDVIFIPPIGKTIAVSGEVKRPAIYEIKQEKDIGQVIDVAGGLTADADPRFAYLERIDASKTRVTRSIDLSARGGAGLDVANGDKLRIARLRPTLDNSVQLAGFVYRPGAFEYHSGLRISDVLPSVDELRPNADRRYIMIRRELPPDRRITVVSADLEAALAAPHGPADVELQPRDQITVFDLSNDRERLMAPIIRDIELQSNVDRPSLVVSVSGPVRAPGRYPLETGMRVSDLIRAGGSMEDSAYSGEAELTHYVVENGQRRQTELVKIDLDAVRRGDKAADVALKPYDFLVVKETPQWDQEAVIEVIGEVRFPGKYPIQRGETLHSVLLRAGGLTDLAYSFGTIYTRKVLKIREREQIEILSNRFQSDLTSLSLQALANTSNNNNPAAAVVVGQQLIDELRQTKPVGRLVVNIDEVMNNAPGKPGDVLVRDGDKVMVPKKTQEVTVIGEVQSPTSHVIRPGLTRDDYIARSGGATAKADKKRIYVVHANGSVLSEERRGFFRRGESMEIQPGDTIVVPLNAERIRPLPLWTAVTTIIYNLAVAAAAIASF